MKKSDIVIHANHYEQRLLETLEDDVLMLCDRIHLMPDTHIGKSVPIGFVGQLNNVGIIPNMIGVDIGCGMTAVKIPHLSKADMPRLDQAITKRVPTGFNIHEENKNIGEYLNTYKLTFDDEIKSENMRLRFEQSIGTLGGGNHFIEVDRFPDFDLLVIHSGSRSLGAKTCEYWSDKLKFDSVSFNQKRLEIIETVEPKMIQTKLNELVDRLNNTSEFKQKYLVNGSEHEKQEFDLYMQDMETCIKYATKNRLTMIRNILEDLFPEQINELLQPENIMDVPHNYISKSEDGKYIVRKGAVSAEKGDPVIIPINMRDGVIIGTGIGNDKWLKSAPHGAGRILSRTKALANLTVADMEEQMKAVYSSTISAGTLDEHPDAYRSIGEILENINETITDIQIGKPIYNFKGEQEELPFLKKKKQRQEAAKQEAAKQAESTIE